MKTTYETASHVELYINRPNGTKETVIHPSFKVISEPMFDQMVTATKAAGKGFITGYKNVKETHQIPKDILENNKKAREFNDTYNEGHTDGYNPYYS